MKMTDRPLKLVRQFNRLSWQAELQIFGYTVVSERVVKAYKSDCVIKGKVVECPPGYTLLVNGTAKATNEECET